MNHVWGYELTISSVDFWEFPSFLFLCPPFVILFHLFCAQSTILSSYASISTFRRLPVAEYPLFVKVHVSLAYNTTLMQTNTFTIRGAPIQLPSIIGKFRRCAAPLNRLYPCYGAIEIVEVIIIIIIIISLGRVFDSRAAWSPLCKNHRQVFHTPLPDTKQYKLVPA